MKIYCIRHGQTDWNIEGKIQGRTDIMLNENGKKEAEEVRESVEKLNIDLIICSPLLRAIQTAEILNKNLKVPIIFDERVIERDFGKLEGTKSCEFNFSYFWNWNNNIKYQGEETMQELLIRLKEFFSYVKEKYDKKNILIVSHGATIRGMNIIFNPDLSLEEIIKIKTKNCQIREYQL